LVIGYSFGFVIINIATTSMEGGKNDLACAGGDKQLNTGINNERAEV